MKLAAKQKTVARTVGRATHVGNGDNFTASNRLAYACTAGVPPRRMSKTLLPLQNRPSSASASSPRTALPS